MSDSKQEGKKKKQLEISIPCACLVTNWVKSFLMQLSYFSHNFPQIFFQAFYRVEGYLNPGLFNPGPFKSDFSTMNYSTRTMGNLYGPSPK
jgi:hypothetical protein